MRRSNSRIASTYVISFQTKGGKQFLLIKQKLSIHGTVKMRENVNPIFLLAYKFFGFPLPCSLHSSIFNDSVSVYAEIKWITSYFCKKFEEYLNLSNRRRDEEQKWLHAFEVFLLAETDTLKARESFSLKSLLCTNRLWHDLLGVILDCRRGKQVRRVEKKLT